MVSDLQRERDYAKDIVQMNRQKDFGKGFWGLRLSLRQKVATRLGGQ